MDLPGSVVHKLAGILDGAAVYNWRTLVERLPEYTHNDAMMFHTEQQQVCYIILLLLLIQPYNMSI